MKLWRYATDALILIGAGLITVGVWLIYPPVALIVAGGLLAFLALLGGKHGSSG